MDDTVLKVFSQLTKPFLSQVWDFSSELERKIKNLKFYVLDEYDEQMETNLSSSKLILAILISFIQIYFLCWFSADRQILPPPPLSFIYGQPIPGAGSKAWCVTVFYTISYRR